MRIITIGSDRRLFEEGSDVRRRIESQAELFESHTLIVFAKKSLGLAEVMPRPNLHIIPTNSSSKLLYGLDALRIGKKEKADLVSAQDPFEIGFAALILSRVLKIPLQVQIHTDLTSPFFSRHSIANLFRTMLVRFVITRASCVRVVSERIRNGIAEKFGTGNATVLPVYEPERESAGSPVTFGFKQFFLMASRLEKEKDIPLALRAFAKVSANHPGLGLVIAGEGSEKPSLERLAQKLHIDSSVLFLGWRNDLPALRKAALAFINTSRYEGYGLSLLAAAREGCPIITTDVGIVGELIQKGDAAVVPVGNEEALVDALLSVLSDPDSRNRAIHLQERAVRACVSESGYKAALKASFETCLKNHS